MKVSTQNKHSRNLKINCFKMRYAPYLNRCLQGETRPQSSTFGFLPPKIYPRKKNQKSLILGQPKQKQLTKQTIDNKLTENN